MKAKGFILVSVLVLGLVTIMTVLVLLRQSLSTERQLSQLKRQFILQTCIKSAQKEAFDYLDHKAFTSPVKQHRIFYCHRHLIDLQYQWRLISQFKQVQGTQQFWQLHMQLDWQRNHLKQSSIYWRWSMLSSVQHTITHRLKEALPMAILQQQPVLASAAVSKGTAIYVGVNDELNATVQQYLVNTDNHLYSGLVHEVHWKTGITALTAMHYLNAIKQPIRWQLRLPEGLKVYFVGVIGAQLWIMAGNLNHSVISVRNRFTGQEWDQPLFLHHAQSNVLVVPMTQHYWRWRWHDHSVIGLNIGGVSLGLNKGILQDR